MHPMPNPISPNMRPDLEQSIRNAQDLAQLKTTLLGVFDLLISDVSENRRLVLALDERISALHRGR